MTTFDELVQRGRACGLSLEEATREARLNMPLVRASVAMQPVPAAPEPSAFEAQGGWTKYDEGDRRWAAQFDRAHDPNNVARRQHRSAELRAQLDALDARIRPLQEQRQQLLAALAQL